MTISVQNETDVMFPFSLEKVASQVIEKALSFEKFPYEAEVDLTLVSEQDIQLLNKENRGIDSVTDVLSFPLIEYSQGGGFYEDLEDQDDFFNPDTGEAMLGDIVICVQRMKQQADEFNHPLLREYAFLIAHSMLHLLGYDHMTDMEEKQMFEKQEEILHLLGITREAENE